MKRVFMVVLLLCLTFGTLQGCMGTTPADTESRDTLDGSKQYNSSGNGSTKIPKINRDVENSKQNDILAIAKKYFNETKVQIEDDLTSEFTRIITWVPSFDGKNQDVEFSRSMSVDVALAVTYYDSKSFNLALAAAVFDKDINSLYTVTNLGTAISSYCDRIAMDGDESRKSEMVRDAASVYLYALKLSSSEGRYTLSSIAPLVSLGNLYLDSQKNKEAYELFDIALTIDPENKKALMSMESYYRTVGNKAKMLALQVQQAKTATVIGEAGNKIEKNNEWIKDGIELEGDELEAFIVKMSELPAVTLADYYDKIDSGMAKKVRETVNSAVNKMDFAVPSADILLQYSHYSHTEDPDFIAALQVFSETNIEYFKSGEWQENLSQTMENLSEMLEGLGVDLSLDGKDLSEYVKEKLQNPGDGANKEANVEISGLDNAVKLAEHLTKAAQAKDKTAVWEDMAKMDPAYSIMTINPFDYANSYDILVQQHNITALKSKKSIHIKNIVKINTAMMTAVTEATMKLSDKVYPLMIEYGQKEAALIEKYEGDELIVKLHALHEEFYPLFNSLVEPIWGQTTEVVSVNYKKLEKYLPIMYKDCMKYIMLISDDEMREKEEDTLKSYLQETVQTALGYVSSAYTLPVKQNINMCGCDTELVNALKEQFEKDREKAANDHLKKQKQDRNDFLSGKLDENSQLYQKIIKKYEYTTDLGFYKYTHNEYKSTTNLSIWTPNATLNYDKMQNHFTGKTYVNADLELSGKVTVIAAEVEVKAKFGYSFVQGKDGSIHPDDIDIRSGLSANMSAGQVLDFSAGAEASALRGLTGNASISMTGNGYIDDFKKENMPQGVGKWIRTPDLSKPVWEGKYGN